ncbi:MAG: hypothetical protein PHN66_01380 [Candidatus Shapirobacteria bacterium]|nr:hypothetical protein [Candidatus Shapirobacteria bacterium]
MPKISKLVFLIISELIFLFFLLIILPSIFIKERPGTNHTTYKDTLSLDFKNSFIQEFTSDQNNLQSISILLKNPALANKSQVKIELQDQNQNTIKFLDTSGLSINDPSWIKFKFPYLNSKKGDKFFIKISTNNQKPDSLFIYGDNKNKSINFKTSYTFFSIQESFKENINQQINNFKNRNIFYSIAYLLLLVLINIFIFI